MYTKIEIKCNTLKLAEAKDFTSLRSSVKNSLFITFVHGKLAKKILAETISISYEHTVLALER